MNDKLLLLNHTRRKNWRAWNCRKRIEKTHEIVLNVQKSWLRRRALLGFKLFSADRDTT